MAEPAAATADELVDMVSTFLRLMEARDLDAARQHLADDVVITFPGGRRFTSLEEQVASSAGRFRSVTKTFDRFDVIDGSPSGGESIVYVFGTLSGEALDGTGFDSVRYIDRFTVRDGVIVDQKVWNDLAESGVL